MYNDPRYDAIFIENRDGFPPDLSNLDSLTVPVLPLILTEDGSLGFSRTYAAPFTTLTDGDGQDRTLGAWSTYTQRDFSDGILQLETLTDTKRYYTGTIDTRYSRAVTLPPKVYGPFELKDTTNSNTPITIGPAETIKLRWVRYRNNLFALAGGKLWLSTFDETAVNINSGVGQVIPNWKIIAADSNTIQATDLTLHILSSAYKLLLATPNGLIAYNPSTGAYDSAPANPATYLRTLGANIAQAKDHQYIISTSPGAPVDLIPGDTTLIVNNFVALGAINYILTNRGIHSGAGANNLILPWNEYETDTAGRIACMWRGKAYIVLGETLQAWDGTSASLANLGLDRLAGLPNILARAITWLEPTTDALYLATNTPGKQSAIFAMTGDGLFHCLYTAPIGNTITTLAIDVRTGAIGGSTATILTSQPRLWWAENNNTYYMYVGRNESATTAISPIFNNLPFPRGFAPAAHLIGAYFGSNTAQQLKHIAAVIITHKPYPLANATDIQCDLSFDQADTWLPLTLARVDSPQHEYITTAPNFNPISVIAQSGNSLILESTDSLSPGNFIRANTQVLQVATVNANTITLARAPQRTISPGTLITPARPEAYEFRVRLRLSTSDSTTTPEILRISIRYAYHTLARARYTLHIRCEDNITTNDGGNYPHDAETLRTLLSIWIQKEPFWLFCPDGALALVRCINASAAPFIIPDQRNKHTRTPFSIITLTLIEVEDSR